MDNKQIFLIGSLIFFVYIFFYLRIVIRQFGENKKEQNYSFDSNDFDGMGNQGRFPNKKPKNRAS